MKLFLTGDSHVAAIKRGHALLASRGQLPAAPPLVIRPFGSAVQMRTSFFVEHDDHLEITDPVYRKRVPVLPARGFATGSTIYLLAGPFNFSAVWARPFWRHHWVTGMPPRVGRPYSLGTLRHGLMARLYYQFRLIDKLLTLGQRLAVVESPGPFRHHPALGLVRADSLVALHRLCRRLVRDELARRDVGVVAVPAECWDDDGFIQARFRSDNPEDGHHANTEFGAVMAMECLRFSGQEAIRGQVAGVAR